MQDVNTFPKLNFGVKPGSHLMRTSNHIRSEKVSQHQRVSNRQSHMHSTPRTIPWHLCPWCNLFRFHICRENSQLLEFRSFSNCCFYNLSRLSQSLACMMPLIAWLGPISLGKLQTINSSSALSCISSSALSCNSSAISSSANASVA